MPPTLPGSVEYVQAAKVGIESLEYIDDLVREYLMFRGFKSTIRALEVDLEQDKDHGFHSDQIVSELLDMATQLRIEKLLEYWQYLSYRFFSHLSPKYHRTTRMFEKRLIRLFLVSAINANKRPAIRQFMDKHGQTLGQQGGDWIPWLGIEYVDKPSERPEFEAYFNEDWLTSLRTALTDFVQTVFPAMAVPRILLFDKDRREREVLQNKVKMYEEQLTGQTKIKTLDQADTVVGSTADGQSTILVEDHIGNVAGVVKSPKLRNQDILGERQGSTNNQEIAKDGNEQDSLDVLRTNDPSGLLKISSEDIYLEHNSGISLAKFSASGESIASYDDESILKIWSPDPLSTAPKLKSELDFIVTAMAWDQKHEHLLYLYDEDGYIRTLNTNSNLMSKQLVQERRHPWIQSMQVSSASSNILTVCSTKPEGTNDLMAQVWDANADKSIGSKRITGSNASTVSRSVGSSEPPISQGVCTALNHNGNLAALAYNTGLVKLLDVRSLEAVATIDTKQKALCAVAFSLNEDSLMAVTETGGLTQWSLQKNNQMMAESTLALETDAIDHSRSAAASDMRLDSDRVAFTPDRESVLAAPSKQTLVFNVDSAALTDAMRRHQDLVSCIDCTVNRSLSASDDGTIRVASYRKV